MPLIVETIFILPSLLNDFLKSYLDIVFALNRQFYPIEKQVIQIVRRKMCVVTFFIEGTC